MSLRAERLPDLTDSLSRLAPVAGALFVSAPDPFTAAGIVESRLAGDRISNEEIALAGVSNEILEEYEALLPKEPGDLKAVLACGAAWAVGLRTATPTTSSSWRPVVSGTDLGPPEFPNRTGESLVQLIMSARRTLRLAPAYIDEAAGRYLSPSIAAATKRGVEVTILVVEQLEKGNATAEIAAVIEELGAPARFRIVRGAASDWFAHMKVLTVDGRAAYIGSANSTLSGLSTNFELGALVEGPAVETVDAFLDRVQRVVEQAALDGGWPAGLS